MSSEGHRDVPPGMVAMAKKGAVRMPLSRFAQVYSTNRELPPDIVEAMRRACASALPCLETTGQPVNPQPEALEALLPPFGYRDKELSESGGDDLLEMIEKEAQRLQASMTVPTIKGVERPVRRVVPNLDLPKFFETVWTFKASLGDGQSIVEASAGTATKATGGAQALET